MRRNSSWASLAYVWLQDVALNSSLVLRYAEPVHVIVSVVRCLCACRVVASLTRTRKHTPVGEGPG